MSSGYYGSNGQLNPHGGTPDKLLNQIISEFGPVFDPCPNNPTFDGLAIQWPREMVVYCNPPYTRGLISKFVKKCFDEWVAGSTVVLLIPNYSDTAYYHEYILPYAEIRPLRGRLKFKGYGGKAASFPSILCIFRQPIEGLICLECGHALIQCQCEPIEGGFE